MVEIYTTPACLSCRKAKSWLDQHGIQYIEKNIAASGITKADIKFILEKTENGFEDIISTRSKAFKEHNLELDEMTSNQLFDFIVANPTVLRRPIIVDKKGRFQVGYNEDEIRSFLPRSLRGTDNCEQTCKECNCNYLFVLERALKDSFIERTQ